jgi:hypothetical protein
MEEEAKIPTPVESRIVYIREVDPRDIPEQARAHVPAGRLFAIHDAAGNRLAFAADREMAFHVARWNAMTPVSAH